MTAFRTGAALATVLLTAATVGWSSDRQDLEKAFTAWDADGDGRLTEAEWHGRAPFERAVSMSVDAYVICSVETYARFGFEYNQRLIDRFGHGLMHFHCNRTDLAAEVARLRGLELFQFGGDTRDDVPDIDRVPAMRSAVGDIPIQVACRIETFRDRLQQRTLPPNVWYTVGGKGLAIDEANTLMEQVRSYRA